MTTQAELVRVLLGAVAPDSTALRALAEQPAFSVYRNTVIKGCVDALEGNFPAVARLVGQAWFRDAARTFALEYPPTDACLLRYGDADFPAFLAGIPTAAQLEYLEGVAQLDVLWRASHTATDAPALDAAVLAQFSPEQLAAQVLQPHPSARWAWFAHQPVPTLWSRSRTQENEGEELPWQAEGLLLVRPAGAVRWQPLSQARCAFLDACAGGETVAAAATAALQTDPETDLAALLGELLLAGTFTSASAHLPGQFR
ncbi:putative DNA-binding domain-containing protein [Polaromonas sp.]|uniref:HvfC/BufC family peptide modification chaperone n=1 Tax=Polaromonas sp. TaxID=1869339 RepID=UPI00356A9679